MGRAKKFTGVIAPLLTPFGGDGRPDPVRFLDHARRVLEAGCTGLAPFGTTSEGNSLSLSERMALLEALVRGGIDPACLMPGTGTSAIGDTLTLTRHAVELGCGGVLVLPPFYYKMVSDEGLFAAIAAVIDRLGDNRLRLYLYHIPPVAVVGYSLDLVARLARAYPGIIAGLKDSSGDWSNTEAVIGACPEIEVFSGSEVFLLSNLRAGGAGCISATCNVNAGAIRGLYDHWRDGDADTRQEGVTRFRREIEREPVIPFLKAIVAAEHGDPAWRQTLPPLSAMAEESAERAIARLAALAAVPARSNVL